MIQSIKISNFRSILELPNLRFGNMTFIIGKNGAGKSTLISALYLTKRLAAKADIDDTLSTLAPFPGEIFARGSRQNRAHIELVVRGEKSQSYRFSYSFTYGGPLGAFRVSEESLERISNASTMEGELIYRRSNNEIHTYDASNKELELVPLNVKESELVLANYNDSEVRSVADLLGDCRVLWFDKNVNASDFRIHNQERLDGNSLDAQVIDLFLNHKKSFDKAVHVIRQLIPEFEAPQVRSIGGPAEEEKSNINNRYIVFWREKEAQDFEYTLSGLSDGNFRIIQLIFSMYSSRNTTCLIGEEIENGQHFGRIKTLLEILKGLSVKLNVQLIFTTHSRDLLTTVSPTDVIYSSKDTQGYSHYDYLDEKVDTAMVKDELGAEPTAKDLIDLGIA